MTDRAPPTAGPLSIVVPTFNERENVEELISRLDRCLKGIAWEVVFVDDDSPDGTAEVVERRARIDSRVRCLKRVGRRGLASACREGMAVSRGDIIAILDADLQHDERLLPRMRDAILEGGCDLVIGSRYLASGRTGAWSRRRLIMSRIATRATRLLLDVALTDPMSGFFMLRRPLFQQVEGRLSGSGFKLLLDIVSSAPCRWRVRELPYEFTTRRHGHSKLDARVVVDFARLLFRHWLRRVGGPMARFCLVGAHGVLVHVAVLDLAQQAMALPFAVAQAVAVAVSMASNFTLNNRLTFGESPLAGRAFVHGFLRFSALCSLGAFVNVVMATIVLHASGLRLPAVCAGIIAGAVCNYATTSLFVWNRSPKFRA